MKSILSKVATILVVIASGVLFSACNPLELKNKSGLQVITDDIEVSIYLDDHFLGDSPFLTKDLKPGEYTIKLEPKNQNLTTYETSINLRKGLLTVITWKPGPTLMQSGGVIYELEKLPSNKQSELSVISIPDGAIISIDGGVKQFAPFIENEILAGNHEFEVTLPSYETQQHTINVVEGHRLSIQVKLAKESDEAELARMETKPSQLSDNNLVEESGQVQGVTDSLTNNPLDASDQKATPSAKPLREPTSDITLGGPKVLIKNTGYFENGQEVLKVRSASSSAGTVIGLVQSGNNYPYQGEQKPGWIKINFNNQPGWVSSDYAEIQQ